MEHRERLRLFTGELGIDLDSARASTLERYALWLSEEALPAGGIGPNEATELIDRHILDSLAFLVPLDGAPSTLIDIGSGVGLPGIPLAVALPMTEVVLLDRSGRRCALLKRAIRVLDLQNVVVVQSEVSRLDRSVDVAVSRASLQPVELLPHLRRIAPLGIVAGSRREKQAVEGYESVKIDSRYLNSPRWLLIMRSS